MEHVRPDHTSNQSLQGHLTIELQLPPEVATILSDLHQDRAGIAAGAMVLIGCVVALTCKYLFRK